MVNPLTPPRGQIMALVDRIRRICLTPRSEWDVIAGEQTSLKDLFRNYAVPLALVVKIVSFIGSPTR